MKQNLLIYIAVDGVGNTQKGCIWERRRGAVSWIRFGGEGLRHLLEGIETCCKTSLMGGGVLFGLKMGENTNCHAIQMQLGDFLDEQ